MKLFKENDHMGFPVHLVSGKSSMGKAMITNWIESKCQKFFWMRKRESLT